MFNECRKRRRLHIPSFTAIGASEAAGPLEGWIRLLKMGEGVSATAAAQSFRTPTDMIQQAVCGRDYMNLWECGSTTKITDQRLYKLQQNI